MDGKAGDFYLERRFLKLKGSAIDMEFRIADTFTFPVRLLTGAYGWKASGLACQRLREVVSEN